MARHGTTHWDVAAYALGVLDPADAARCEAHLAQCQSCAADLEALLPTTKLLADVDVETLREMPEPSSVDRLLDQVRVERGQLRRRRRLTAALSSTAVAVLVGVALFVGASWLGTGPDGLGPPLPTVGAQVETELVSATDDDTGVRAEVQLRQTEWGTLVTFELWAVEGPLAECRLVLVHSDGTAEMVGSWRVPEEGYGTAQRPDPLSLPAATVADRADLAELQIVALDPDTGDETALVTVPL